MNQIKINGEIKEIEIPLNLAQLYTNIYSNNSNEGVAIALNLEIIPKENWNTILIQPGDEIEIIRATCGG